MYSAKGTKIRWQEDGCLYSGRVVARHDNQKFLLTLTLDTNGVLQFPALNHASTQTTESLLFEHDSTQTVRSSPSQHAFTQTAQWSPFQHACTQTARSSPSRHACTQTARSSPFQHASTQTARSSSSKSEQHSFCASSCCTSNICDELQSSTNRLSRHRGLSFSKADLRYLSPSPAHLSRSSSESLEKDTKKYPPPSIPRRAPSLSSSRTLFAEEPSTSTGINHRRFTNNLIGRTTAELHNQSQPSSCIMSPSKKTSVSQKSSTSSHGMHSPATFTSRGNNLVQLVEDSSLVISKEELDNISYHQKDNPRAMVRELLLLFVGGDNLIEMIPFGDPGRSLSAIPAPTYQDTRRELPVIPFLPNKPKFLRRFASFLGFVNLHNQTHILDHGEYREVCSLLCRRLRNPRR